MRSHYALKRLGSAGRGVLAGVTALATVAGMLIASAVNAALGASNAVSLSGAPRRQEVDRVGG
jgi:hypothetical protein